MKKPVRSLPVVKPSFYFLGSDGTKYHTTRKHAFLQFPNLSLDRRMQIRVTYTPTVYNEATLDSYEAVKQFIADCTEPNLVRHIQDGVRANQW